MRLLAGSRCAGLNGRHPFSPLPGPVRLSTSAPSAGGDKADHVAQKMSVGALSQKRLQVHRIVGHRCALVQGEGCNPTLSEDLQ